MKRAILFLGIVFIPAMAFSYRVNLPDGEIRECKDHPSGVTSCYTVKEGANIENWRATLPPPVKVYRVVDEKATVRGFKYEPGRTYQDLTAQQISDIQAQGYKVEQIQ